MTVAKPENTEKNIDAGLIVDNATLSAVQIRILVTAAVVMILEGLDIQCISFVAPAIVKDWGIDISAFGIVFTAGLLGAVLGAAIFGPLGDKIGRRPIIIINVVLFGIGTVATPLATDVPSLLIIRFLASLGLGGVAPNAIALVSEYAPLRVKALFVSIVAVSPLVGGMLGGIVSRWIIPIYGWESVFYIAGSLSIAILVPVIKLPESIRFMIATGRNHQQVVHTLNRIKRSSEYSSSDRFYLTGGEQQTPKLRDLFGPGLVFITLFLWLALAANLFMAVLLINWLPLLLEQQGLASGTAILGASIFNGGGIVGGVVLAILIDRYGAYRTLFCSSVIAAIVTVFIGLIAPAVLPTIFCVFLSGFFCLGSYAGFSALAVNLYPVQLRSTGIGCALAIGKCGAALGPLAVSVALGFKVSITGIYFMAAGVGLLAAISVPLIVWKVNAARIELKSPMHKEMQTGV